MFGLKVDLLSTLILPLIFQGLTHSLDIPEEGVCSLDTATCLGAQISATFPGYDGHPRFALDNVLTAEKCARLIELNRKTGHAGNGYPKDLHKQYGSPYTNFESFKAVALQDLETRHKNDPELVTEYDVNLLKETANLVLKQVRALFHRPNLDFDFVHLVCREAVHSIAAYRNPNEDLSHPIHADNGAIGEDGELIPFEYNPDLVVRNASALLYLNSDFDGGEFMFAHRPTMQIEQIIKPLCGRLVTFDSGDYHGVRAITKGKRCAVALWFYQNDDSYPEDEDDDSIPNEPLGPEISRRRIKNYS